MPDIASALQKALNEWEPTVDTPPPAPAPTKPYFTVTNNVTRVTFNYVRDNPGKNRVEVAKALEKQGYKPGSVSSLVGQMIRQGLIRESAQLLYAATNEYAPLKGSKVVKALAAKPQEQQRKIVTITRKAAPEAEPTPQSNGSWNVTNQLNSMSIVQARLMYDALRKIFGG
jgi:hypothetical protein